MSTLEHGRLKRSTRYCAKAEWLECDPKRSEAKLGMN